MKKVACLVIIFIIPQVIIIPIITNYFACFTPICMASEKITPYKPEVRYSESYSVLRKEETSKETKPPEDPWKIWRWVAGGLVLVGVAVALGGGGGSEEPVPPNDNVDVDVSW